MNTRAAVACFVTILAVTTPAVAQDAEPAPIVPVAPAAAGGAIDQQLKLADQQLRALLGIQVALEFHLASIHNELLAIPADMLKHQADQKKSAPPILRGAHQ